MEVVVVVVVVVMENPRGPIGGGVVVVVVVTAGVTKSHGEGRMKLSPASPQVSIGLRFWDHMRTLGEKLLFIS